MSRGNRLLPVPVVLAVTLLASQGAFAWESCLQIFSGHYPESRSDDVYVDIDTTACQVCHRTSGGGPFNAYGQDLLDNGATGAGFNCDAVDFVQALVAVEDLDSDNADSLHPNIDEITAGTQPGWCDDQGGQITSCTNSAGTLPGVTLDPAPAGTANRPPVAEAGGPYAGEAGSTLIQFDGSGSGDPDGDTLTFTWEFGDGNTASGMMPTHTYAEAGNYEVSLVVNDSRLDSEPAFASAAISAPLVNIAPVADPGGPYAGEPGQAIAFDGSASTDSNGDTLTFSWDFGDGTTGSGVTPTHDYAAAGVYEVSLTVNDGEFDSAVATTRVEVVESIAGQPDGAALYDSNCRACHGDPWDEPAVDERLLGVRRVGGARSCNIEGSIFGTSVFPNGVPAMQFLQGLTEGEIDAIAEYLNSRVASGEQRYVTTCAGCHGGNGSGGRVDEDVHGESSQETWGAILDEEEMHYMACMPRSDVDAIADFLAGYDDDFDDDGIRDDDDHDDDGDGIDDDADHDDDNDGRSDDEEREDGTDPRDEDSDDDGVNDGDEHEDGTDPRDRDSDDDGLDDGEERHHGTDPKDPDTDDDGRTDGEEVNVLGTDPLVADSATSNDSSGGGGTTGLPFMLMLLAALRRRPKS